MERRIYFDHAATTPTDPEIFEKMRPYFTDVFGNPDSLHSFGRNAVSGVDFARDKVAELLGASPSEIYFTSGGTESDNWAVLVGAMAKKAEGRTRILLSAIEHDAAYHSALALKDKGFQVEILPVNERGMVEENTLKNAIGSDVGLVCVMTVNNETGVVQPVQALSKIAKAHGALFFTDAVQAAPYLPLQVNDLGVDMLSISAHKFYGPKGAGVLYIKKGIKIERLIAGGQQQRGMRAGTVNTPSVVGLALALEKAIKEREENNEKITSVKKAFKDALLCAVDGVTENGGGEKIPSVFNAKIEGVDNAAFLRDMDLHGIALSAGSACESSSLTPSRTLTAMGLEEQEVKSSVRFSFGKDNTVKEALAAAKIAAEVIKKLRRF